MLINAQVHLLNLKLNALEAAAEDFEKEYKVASRGGT